MLFDAHLGDALATFTYVDRAIKKDAKPGIRNPSLDMFDLSNGYPGDTAAGMPVFGYHFFLLIRIKTPLQRQDHSSRVFEIMLNHLFLSCCEQVLESRIDPWAA